MNAHPELQLQCTKTQSLTEGKEMLGMAEFIYKATMAGKGCVQILHTLLSKTVIHKRT